MIMLHRLIIFPVVFSHYFPRCFLLIILPVVFCSLFPPLFFAEWPIPLLYMRTVLLSLKIAPTLSNFVVGILHRLVSKQVKHK